MSLSMMDTVPPMIFLFFLWTSEAFILSLLFSALNSKIILGFSLYISRCSTILGCNNAFLPSKLQTTKYIYLTKGQQYSGRTAVRVQMCTKTRKGNKNIIHTALQCVKKKSKIWILTFITLNSWSSIWFLVVWGEKKKDWFQGSNMFLVSELSSKIINSQ